MRNTFGKRPDLRNTARPNFNAKPQKNRGQTPTLRIGDEIVTFRPSNRQPEVRLPPVSGIENFSSKTDFQQPPIRESPKSAEGNPFPNFRPAKDLVESERPRASSRRVSEGSDLPQGEERKRLLAAALAAEAREKEERAEEQRKLEEAGAARRKKLFDKRRMRLSGIGSRQRRPESDSDERGRSQGRRERVIESQGMKGREEENQKKIVEEAAKAVRTREESGTVKSSPVVWAAVTTLADFLTTLKDVGDSSVPVDVLAAIKRLTVFIKEEHDMKEGELESMVAVSQFTKRRLGEEDRKPFTRPSTQRPTTTTRRTTQSTRRSTNRTTRRPTTRPSFLPTRKPTRRTTRRTTRKPKSVRPLTQKSFTRPPPPAYFTERPLVPTKRTYSSIERGGPVVDVVGSDVTEEERTNFFSEKYLESDMIRRPDEKYSDYPDYPDYSAPRVKFKFKFNTETGIFSANTDLEVRIGETQGRGRSPGPPRPAPPPTPMMEILKDRFQIFTLPT